MTALDPTVFLWLNLPPQTPPAILNLALFATLYLPHWIVATTLTVALVGGHGWRMPSIRRSTCKVPTSG